VGGRPLTYKQIARSLGVSESTLYKTRKGTRSGTNVLRVLRGEREGVYQVVVSSVDADGVISKQSMNLTLDRRDLRALGTKRYAFSEPLLAAHPRTEDVVRQELLFRNVQAWRSRYGSKPWNRAMVESAVIETIRRPRHHRAVPLELHLGGPRQLHPLTYLEDVELPDEDEDGEDYDL
jgi:transposase-like protein